MNSYIINKSIIKNEKKNVAYLVILIALSLNFWGFKPLVGAISNDVFLVIKVLYLAFGYFFLFRRNRYSILDKRLKTFWVIILGILISMIPANLYYGQNISTSIVAYRVNILWLTIPVLFKMSPSFRQISKSALIITAIMYFLYFLRQSNPSLFAMDEETLIRFQQGEDIYLNGYIFASIPIFYYLGELNNKIRSKDLLFILFCFAYIFLLQNRTQLFIMSLLIGFTFLKIRSKYKILIIPLLAAIIIYFIVQTSQDWYSLIEETQENIADPDYNRNKAYVYFLTMASPNIWCQIFGNGFLSSHATSHMQDLMLLGIYNSDVGFIGFWNQYGIIPIIAFIYSFILAFKKRDVPYGVRMWCLMLIGAIPTTSYFNGGPLIYDFFYYLVFAYAYQYQTKSNIRNYGSQIQSNVGNSNSIVQK